MPPSYIRVRAVVWAYGRGQTDRQTDTQTRVTTIHFASSTTDAECSHLYVDGVGGGRQDDARQEGGGRAAVGGDRATESLCAPGAGDETSDGRQRTSHVHVVAVVTRRRRRLHTQPVSDSTSLISYRPITLKHSTCSYKLTLNYNTNPARPVSTWIGDRLWAGKPPRFVTNHPGQLSLLPYTAREMSSGQSAVMLCGWGVKAGMVHSTCG